MTYISGCSIVTDPDRAASSRLTALIPAHTNDTFLQDIPTQTAWGRRTGYSRTQIRCNFKNRIRRMVYILRPKSVCVAGRMAFSHIQNVGVRNCRRNRLSVIQKYSAELRARASVAEPCWGLCLQTSSSTSDNFWVHPVADCVVTDKLTGIQNLPNHSHTRHSVMLSLGLGLGLGLEPLRSC